MVHSLIPENPHSLIPGNPQVPIYRAHRLIALATSDA